MNNSVGNFLTVRLLAGAFLFVLPGSARATYSIVASDQMTQQVGGAGTSCVGSLSVRIIYGVAIGHGAVHAQAQINTLGRDRAAVLLGDDVDPGDIIAEITFSIFDPAASVRQYGFVYLFGLAPRFIGE